MLHMCHRNVVHFGAELRPFGFEISVCVCVLYEIIEAFFLLSESLKEQN